MTPTLHHYYLARITLEAVTPLSIATGKDDGVFDVTLARDANDLPALPGSAIAGVLRHLFWELHGKDAMKAVFGWQNGEKGGSSRLHVSWGCIQNSKGEPEEGLLLNGEKADPLLKSALVIQDTPTHRERVRINHRGAATHQGKFDRTVLLAGHRFNAEIALWSDQANDPHWQQVLDLLQHPLFRLGGNTRAGLGRLKLVHAHAGHFDLKTANGRGAFSNLSRTRGIGKTNGLNSLPLKISTNHAHNQFITATIKLKPRGFWRIGQGDAPQLKADDKPADMLPKLEPRVIWDDKTKQGSIGPAQLLVPATSLKGALSHRIAFHANRLAGRWATEQALNNNQDYSKESCEEVQSLFGFINEDKGQVGRVLFDDSFIQFGTKDLGLMMHNAIDRFTGGVREHMLFMEELVWKKAIEIECTIDTKGITDPARRALHLALEDLCNGRLSLGGGASKGHGFFDGSVSWSDNGAWINNPTSIAVLVSSTSKAA